MDQAIDNLVISVTASADSAARSLDRFTNAIRPMGAAAKSAASDMSALGNETKKVGSAVQRAGRDASISGRQIKRAGKDMEDAGKAADKASQGIGKYWAALKRVAFYRSVRFVIKSITEAFKTGITNMYQWSKVMDGTFARSMDRIATSTLYLKNSLGAMMAPIINTLAPIIDYVVDGLVWIINHVNMLFAALSGSSTYTAAKKVATTWGDASKDVASSTKKAADDIKRTILGFDEINKLEKQNEALGGSGGGLSGNSNNFASMFEQRPVNSTVKGIADVIRNTLGPVFDFVGDHLDTILKVVGLIGGALLALKIGSKFSTGLSNVLTTIGKINTALASVATAALTIALTYQFTNKYLETGSYAYLVGNAITTALGGAITGLTMSRAFGAKAGLYSAAATIGISGLIDMVLGIKNVNAKGLTKENVTTMITGAVKAALASGLIAKAAGFSVVSGLAAGALTMGISIELVALFSLIRTEGLDNVKEGIQQGIKIALGIEKPDSTQYLIDWNGKPYTKSGSEKPTQSTSGVDAVSSASMSGFYSAMNSGTNLWKKIGDGLGGLVKAFDGLFGAKAEGGYGQYGRKPTENSAKIAYASKNPRSNNNIIRFDPTIGMSDAAIQKAKQFTSAIVSNMGTVKTTISDTVDTSKTVLGGMATLIEQAARDSQNVSWEPVGRNITQTLSKGETQSFPEAKAKFNRDMEALRNSGYTYSYDAVGKYIVSTLTTGIDTDKWKPIKSVLDMAWSMFNKKEEVPWITFGDEIPKEVSNGVNNNKNWAVQAAVDLGFAMYNAMNGVSFWDIGYNIIADVYNGFVNNTSWLANTLANTAKGLYNIMSGKTAVIATSTTTSRKTTVSNAKKPTKSAKAKSLGGILSNGIWTDIPQFANGTLSAGSLFWAGEAGPEIVGHVGGRTEVLNKSQLASAIYSAVQSAMAPAASNFAAAASSMRNPDAGQADYETLLMYIQQGNDATMRQNELLRQQNDYLRSINDKEWTAELTTAAVQRSLNRSNLRAGTTVVPVG